MKSLGLFKKKINPSEGKAILEHIISLIIKATGKRLNDILRSLLEKLKVPVVSIELPEFNYHSHLAKAIVKSITDEEALYILQEIKKMLDKYKI